MSPVVIFYEILESLKELWRTPGEFSKRTHVTIPREIPEEILEKISEGTPRGTLGKILEEISGESLEGILGEILEGIPRVILLAIPEGICERNPSSGGINEINP